MTKPQGEAEWRWMLDNVKREPLKLRSPRVRYVLKDFDTVSGSLIWPTSVLTDIFAKHQRLIACFESWEDRELYDAVRWGWVVTPIEDLRVILPLYGTKEEHGLQAFVTHSDRHWSAVWKYPDSVKPSISVNEYEHAPKWVQSIIPRFDEVSR